MSWKWTRVQSLVSCYLKQSNTSILLFIYKLRFEHDIVNSLSYSRMPTDCIDVELDIVNFLSYTLGCLLDLIVYNLILTDAYFIYLFIFWSGRCLLYLIVFNLEYLEFCNYFAVISVLNRFFFLFFFGICIYFVVLWFLREVEWLL